MNPHLHSFLIKTPLITVFLCLLLVTACGDVDRNSINQNEVALTSQEGTTLASHNSHFENEENSSASLQNTPRYPIIGKRYKFLKVKDSIHYVLILKRTNDSTLVFRTGNDIDSESEMYSGTAIWIKNAGTGSEKSSLNGNPYQVTGFFELKDSTKVEIRIGIDSLGSGNRLLLRFIKTEGNRIITDLNMAN